MKIEILPGSLTICKLACIQDIDLDKDFYFIGRTDQEISLVCRSEDVPSGAYVTETGWRGFRIQGVLDFSLTGILSGLSGILAENKIGIFAVSTFNTDYILVKKKYYKRAMDVLEAAGYTVT